MEYNKNWNIHEKTLYLKIKTNNVKRLDGKVCKKCIEWEKKYDELLLDYKDLVSRNG